MYFKDWLYGKNFQNQSPLKVHVHHVLQGFDCLYVAGVKWQQVEILDNSTAYKVTNNGQ